jgi:hypothetical protein
VYGARLLPDGSGAAVVRRAGRGRRRHARLDQALPRLALAQHLEQYPAIGVAMVSWVFLVFLAGASDRVDVTFGIAYVSPGDAVLRERHAAEAEARGERA